MKRKNFMLTEHFSYSDVTRSAWADRHHVDNTPDCLQLAALTNTCLVVGEPLWRRFGPVSLKAAFRTELVNIGANDVGCSKHLTGEALDFRLPDLQTGIAYYCYIVKHVDFDQVFFEHSHSGDMWLHCSVCYDARENRHQAFPNYRSDYQPKHAGSHDDV